MRRFRLAAVAATTLLLASACSDESGAASPDEPEFSTYVALGDSFTSGPMVPEPVPADGCHRSTGNYPALLAERLEVAELVDVSCGGARTTDLTGRQQTRETTVPPQLDALSKDTGLVTLGIGGNDFGLFASLVGTCTILGLVTTTGSPCADALGQQTVLGQVRDVGDRVTGALRLVQERAPEATVVLVGYPRLVPEEGRCDAIPMAAGDYEFAARVTTALNDALAQAADRAGVLYADLYEASTGHDICADDPWVNGRTGEPGRASAYHPLPDGMAATAAEIESLLARR